VARSGVGVGQRRRPPAGRGSGGRGDPEDLPGGPAGRIVEQLAELRKAELTAVGDAVNITARLASAAAAGEVLVTSDAASAADLDPALERRSLELKGKRVPTEVISLTVGMRTPDPASLD
jgi:class 3 adenylate cyclase